jgi:hypothetical protein
LSTNLDVDSSWFEILHGNFVGFAFRDDDCPDVDRSRTGKCSPDQPASPSSVEGIHVLSFQLERHPGL